MDNTNPSPEPQQAPTAPAMPEVQVVAGAGQKKGWISKFMEMMGFGESAPPEPPAEAPAAPAPEPLPTAPAPEVPAPAPAAPPAEAPTPPADPNAPKAA